MKTLLKILGVVLVIIIIGYIVLSLTIDGIVRSNIEEVGSELLQTDVQVEDVSVSLFNSRGYIDGVTIANPEGFSDSAAVELHAIDIKLDLISMLTDTMIVDSLIIEQPEVYVEQTLKGVNLKVLQENLAESSTDESGGLIIDYLLVEDGLITLHSDIAGGELTQVELEQFEQEGIGREGSDTIKAAARQILEPVLERALRAALEGGVREEVEDRIRNLLDG